jgi:hypothetical protein
LISYQTDTPNSYRLIKGRIPFFRLGFQHSKG